VEELTEAQKKTEEALRTVIKEQKKIRKDFGGLSDSIGYTLEDRAIRCLPNILQKDFGLKIVERYAKEKIEGLRVYMSFQLV